MWQCFRAKCGVTGATQGYAFSKGDLTPKPRPTWEGTPHEVPPKVAEAIFNKWGLVDVPHWYWTTDYGGRIAMSVRTPDDVHRGWVLRSLTSTQSSKALTFLEEGVGLSWYKKPNAPTVLVEDIPSAARAAKHVSAVALLGTGVGDPRATEIAKQAQRPIIIALDQDATQKSFDLAKKYSLLWGEVKILPLKTDIKDMEEEELCQLLQ